jgi:hypothetical protein
MGSRSHQLPCAARQITWASSPFTAREATPDPGQERGAPNPAWFRSRLGHYGPARDRTIGRETYELGPWSMKAPVEGLPQ